MPPPSTFLLLARRALGHPLPWLVLHCLLVAVLLARGDGLDPRRVPDTFSYIEAARSVSVTDALSRTRTYGYPLFLRLAERQGGDVRYHWGRVPPLQLGVYLLAVVLFWWAVRVFTRSPWTGFVAATPLLYSSVMPLVDNLQPDFLAAAMVVGSVSLLLLLTRRPQSWWLWPALTAVVFTGYQMRPAGVFLAGLLPILAAALGWLVERRAPRRALRLAAGVAVATLVPLVLFGGIRKVAVGHFGLVSFGGYNAAGMAACFVDPELAEELPPPHRETARGIWRARQRRGWVAMTEDDDPVPWFFEYSDNIWDISLEVIRSQLEREGAASTGTVDWNQRLNDFSRAVIHQRPKLYLRWIRAAIGYGLRQLVRDPWIVWPSVLLVLALPLTLPRLGWSRDRDPRPVLGLLFVALSYFAGYLVLVSTVSYPFERYFASMSLLLPPALCGLLFWIGRGRIESRVAARHGGLDSPKPTADIPRT